MANRTSWTQLHTVTLPEELAAVCVAADVFILLSNIMVLLTFNRLGKLTIQHYLMLGLVGSDLTMLIGNAMLTIFVFMREVWLTDIGCFLVGCLTVTAAMITASIHICLSIDRWVTVAYPYAYREYSMNQKSKRMALVVILLIHVFPGPALFLTWWFDQLKFYFDPLVAYCLADFGAKGGAGLILSSAVSIVFPCFIEVPAYTYIIWRISKMKGTNRCHIVKAVRTVLVTLGVYYICWLPMGIWVVWDIVSPDLHPPSWFPFFTIQMLVINSGMSCIVYYFTLPKFKEAFLNATMLGKCFSFLSKIRLENIPAARPTPSECPATGSKTLADC